MPKEENLLAPVSFLINEASFKELYLAYWQKMYAVCFNNTKDRELSKEMVQDIFKSLWEGRDRIRIQQSIEYYLIRAAKLKVCEYIRNSVTAQRHLEIIKTEYCDADHCTENEIAYHELDEHVNILVDTLSCQCRKVYQLSQQQGLSNKEVASALLISEKAVEYHLHKAKSLLKSKLFVFRS
ncbi:sigma-70 family RNA polymerase sigma factor [Mucilaginibacter sp. SMC90]|uniref:sigma-70 family RNA polymerase sigma factor n=1 Tax=Mucilaginibacter sp. SMC90 TaxID=2929803 RepID=UPI001FB22EA5|nr:sigma-70 family RNA polymerase sigma factor [Mucilaginibacter sp. SMC90]UOE46509.1 sigma-70 family RNA polymerase sigma factor [Mucilaginibacter sp. SMC90]